MLRWPAIRLSRPGLLNYLRVRWVDPAENLKENSKHRFLKTQKQVSMFLSDINFKEKICFRSGLTKQSR